jgi:hypothetical protein
MGIDGGDTKYLLPLGKLNFKKQSKTEKRCVQKFQNKIFNSTPGQYCFALVGAHQQEAEVKFSPVQEHAGRRKERATGKLREFCARRPVPASPFSTRRRALTTEGATIMSISATCGTWHSLKFSKEACAAHG